MNALKLNQTLDSTLEYEEFLPNVRGQHYDEQLDEPYRKNSKIFVQRQVAICCTLVRCYDRMSVSFLPRPYREKCLMHGKCCVRDLKRLKNHVCKRLNSDLKNLRKGISKNFVDCNY